MPSRRSHPKSRHGCRQCKTRKVKCDIQRPACGNCERRKQTCEFAIVAQPHYSASTPLVRQSTCSNLVIADHFSLMMNVQYLELLHHFTTDVCFTISNEPKVQRMWQVDIPKLALSYPYLMHCILGVSALHLVHVATPFRDYYRATAVRHQNLALSAFRPLLSDITAENCDALFASSSLVVIFAAASQQSPGTITRLEAIEGILDICELVKGAYVVVQNADGWVRTGLLEPQLSRKPWDDPPPLSKNVDQAIRNLMDTIEALPETERIKSIYFSAAHLLTSTFAAVAVNADHSLIAYIWLVLVDRQYIELLKAKEQMALVILAHYGVILHGSLKHWWAGNAGFDIVSGAYDALESKWRPAISWAMQFVGMNDSYSSGDDSGIASTALDSLLRGKVY